MLKLDVSSESSGRTEYGYDDPLRHIAAVRGNREIIYKADIRHVRCLLAGALQRWAKLAKDGQL